MSICGYLKPKSLDRTVTCVRTKVLTDHISSRPGGLAVLWRPRPSGTRQYIYCRDPPPLVFCKDLVLAHLFNFNSLSRCCLEPWRFNWVPHPTSRRQSYYYLSLMYVCHSSSRLFTDQQGPNLVGRSGPVRKGA